MNNQLDVPTDLESDKEVSYFYFSKQTFIYVVPGLFDKPDDEQSTGCCDKPRNSFG